MFAFLYHSRGGITFDSIRRAYMESDSSGHARYWISSDNRIGIIWINAALLTARQNQEPQRNEPFVLAHGRLDAPQEIREFLHADNAVDDSHLIALTALHAGEAAPNRLYGDFAFAHWTGEALFIATDHIRQKSLYYTKTKYGFAVATRLTALLALPDVSRVLHAERLALLTQGNVGQGQEYTAYADIRSLSGGCCKWLHANRETPTRRWWQPDIAIRRSYKDPLDYTGELTALFEAAVHCRLPKEGPVSCTLSGGLDSTLVAGYAAPILADGNRILHAWTSVPHPSLTPARRAGWDSSDWPYASELVSLHPNIRHHAISPENICLLDVFHVVHAKSATPVRNSANHLWLTEIANGAQQAQCHIVLTGTHGNGGISYAGHGGTRRMIRRAQWGRFAKHLRNMPDGRGKFVLHQLMSACMNEFMRDHLRRLREKKPSRPELSLLRPAARALYEQTPPDQSPARKRQQWADFMARPKTAFAADLSAHANTDIRDPTADRRLHEYLLNCPPDMFVGDGFERLQARLLGAGKVPDSIRWRRNRGEQVPEEAGFFTLYPERYRAAWNEIKHSPWINEYVDTLIANRTLDDLIHGRSIPRAMATALHRIFDIGLFITHAQRHHSCDQP